MQAIAIPFSTSEQIIETFTSKNDISTVVLGKIHIKDGELKSKYSKMVIFKQLPIIKKEQYKLFLNFLNNYIEYFTEEDVGGKN